MSTAAFRQGWPRQSAPDLLAAQRDNKSLCRAACFGSRSLAVVGLLCCYCACLFACGYPAPASGIKSNTSKLSPVHAHFADCAQFELPAIGIAHFLSVCAALHNLPEWGIIGHLVVTQPKACAQPPTPW